MLRKNISIRVCGAIFLVHPGIWRLPSVLAIGYARERDSATTVFRLEVQEIAWARDEAHEGAHDEVHDEVHDKVHDELNRR